MASTLRKQMARAVSFLLIFTAFTASGSAQARTVAPENRALVILTDLDTHGFPALAPLYNSLENIGIGLPQLPILRDAYREIHVLRDQEATLANFHTLLLQLSGRHEVDTIDTILMLHGLPEELSFFERSYSMAEIQEEMTHAETIVERLRLKIMQKKLRLMYNTSCFGASHRNEFRAIGYDTVIGAVGVNANSEFEFPSFLTLWTSGATVEQALAPSNTPTALFIADSNIRVAGMIARNILRETNSEKRIGGDRDLTINLSAR